LRTGSFGQHALASLQLVEPGLQLTAIERVQGTGPVEGGAGLVSMPRLQQRGDPGLVRFEMAGVEPEPGLRVGVQFLPCSLSG